MSADVSISRTGPGEWEVRPGRDIPDLDRMIEVAQIVERCSGHDLSRCKTHRGWRLTIPDVERFVSALAAEGISSSR